MWKPHFNLSFTLSTLNIIVLSIRWCYNFNFNHNTYFRKLEKNDSLVYCFSRCFFLPSSWLGNLLFHFIFVWRTSSGHSLRSATGLQQIFAGAPWRGGRNGIRCITCPESRGEKMKSLTCGDREGFLGRCLWWDLLRGCLWVGEGSPRTVREGEYFPG